MPQEGVRGLSSRLRLEPSERQFRFMLRHPRGVGFMVRLALLVPVRWWPGRNVTLVRAMTPPDVDFAAIMRDDALWAAVAEVMTPLLHATVEACGTILPSGDTYVGLEGFRAMALEWYAPFVSYRVEPGEGVDLGERVFVPYRCFGVLREVQRRSRSSTRLSQHSGNVESPALRSTSRLTKPATPRGWRSRPCWSRMSLLPALTPNASPRNGGRRCRRTWTSCARFMRTGNAASSTRPIGHTPRSSTCPLTDPTLAPGRAWQTWQRISAAGLASGRSSV